MSRATLPGPSGGLVLDGIVFRPDPKVALSWRARGLWLRESKNGRKSVWVLMCAAGSCTATSALNAVREMRRRVRVSTAHLGHQLAGE